MVDVLSLIGNTPIIRIEPWISSISKNVLIYAKLEFYNPGGSIKDRPAYFIIRDLETKGILNSSKILIDSTSGNTGIAYAMICSIKKYPLTLVVPSNASEERKKILSFLGANVIYSDPLEGTDGAQEIVYEIIKKNPDKYILLDQYSNPNNYLAHYNTTALEIISQTNGKVTHFICSIGTSGTFVGTSKRLKEFNPLIKTYTVEPDSEYHGVEGVKHLASSKIPAIFDSSLVDGKFFISTEDAYRMVKEIAKRLGIMVGPSSGLNLCAAFELAKRIDSGVIVTVFPDSITRYFSNQSLWNF
ncbi:MAG: cysteine synthase family protein [Brevinematales bacterium]|nr:cysteine synthase family protein [Brevinematales bacterium]